MELIKTALLAVAFVASLAAFVFAVQSVIYAAQARRLAQENVGRLKAEIERRESS